jgi:hypothetical protein
MQLVKPFEPFFSGQHRRMFTLQIGGHHTYLSGGAD